MRLFTAALASLFLIFNVSCKKENSLDCFTPNGETVSETRVTGTFDTVEVISKIDLFVSMGATHSVVVTAGKNILHNIKTEVRAGKLVVDNRNTCNFVRGYKRHIKVEVFTPYLKYLKNSGVGPATIAPDRVQDTLVVRAESSGDIFINGNYTQIRTSSHGNGDIYLKGRSKELQVYTYGTNYVHAENIIVTGYIFIQSQTLGDCIMNTDSLSKFDCKIEGPGNVYYTGDPAILEDLSNKDLYTGRLYKSINIKEVIPGW